MSRLAAIITNQRKLFFNDKGMILFYLASIVVFGGVFPLFIHETLSQLSLIMFMTVSLQRQWAAESVAGERENRTLETLLSTPVSSRMVLFGKVLFNLICAGGYFLLMVLMLMLVRQLKGAPALLTAGSGAVSVIAVIFMLLVTACYGVLRSARSASVREAGTRPLAVCYLMLILMLAAVTAMSGSNGIPAETAGVMAGLYFIISGGVIIYATVRIRGLDRAALMSVEKHRQAVKKEHAKGLSGTVRSRTVSVFIHEVKFIATFKGLMLQIGILALAPPLFIFVGSYYLGKIDLYYGVLLTILMVPRIPSNLIACSVGGEKAYQTGESILSTPISAAALFRGKVLVPLLVSVLILLISAPLNLVMANFLTGSGLGSGPILYDAAQMVLLSGVALGVSAVMILASCMLSLKARTPRIGLYISTLLGMVFVLPVLAIVYLIEFKLAAALIYFAVLLAVCAVLYSRIRKASRMQLLASLR